MVKKIRKFKTFGKASITIYGVYSYKNGRLLSNHQTLAAAKKEAIKRGTKHKTMLFIKSSKNLLEY